ncbi:MAG: carboxymuconolactone decarboxylase family protein [Alphaproteobacteria bacterium]|nr:carboxymuconolactone decarboxylase family protein [Alphaproteobacteria bacterium]MBT4083136.1 carboxymuconolactone decarboxylase family protein [Alphaproteobacteria bacterium]MBT4544575.1 carboxymuconolactone decarboxylase family protein [Alphaproteobacteria bacterium]MBT7747619.1 carboxymuconolactone decarboxylase family protein [Alphaproteobacteria bacterium]
MSTVPPIQTNSTNNDPRVEAVFEDIRETRGSGFINNFWRYLAFDPDLLAQTWAEVKAVMVTPSDLDPLTKEMIYMAVSIANSCPYCVHSHTAAAKAKGMTDGQYADLLKVVSLAAKTNHLVTGLQVPVDPEFDHEVS